jgi:hypothetical protein
VDGNQLTKAGEELYGPQWRKKLAKEIGVGTTMIWRYRTGLYPIPKKVELAILKLLSDSRKSRKP